MITMNEDLITKAIVLICSNKLILLKKYYFRSNTSSEEKRQNVYVPNDFFIIKMFIKHSYGISFGIKCIYI